MDHLQSSSTLSTSCYQQPTTDQHRPRTRSRTGFFRKRCRKVKSWQFAPRFVRSLSNQTSKQPLRLPFSLFSTPGSKLCKEFQSWSLASQGKVVLACTHVLSNDGGGLCFAGDIAPGEKPGVLEGNRCVLASLRVRLSKLARFSSQVTAALK